MVTQIFYPPAEAVLDSLDPALRECMLRVDEAMEEVRSGSGTSYAAVWADESEDPGIMYPQPGAPTAYGAQVKETFQGYKVDGLPKVELITEYERIVATKDLAFAVLFEHGMPRKADGTIEDNDLAGNVTYIYQRFGDHWKLIHRHVHGMNKFSLHTYDVITCPECGESMLETPFTIHCRTVHDMEMEEINKIKASQIGGH